MTYDQWLSAVDEILLAYIGLSSDCMVDFPAYDLYKSEISPREGAAECLRYQDSEDAEILADNLLDM